jgi:hypothetical protein
MSKRTIGAVALAGAVALVAVTAFCQIAQIAGPVAVPQQKKDHVVAPARNAAAEEPAALENSVRLSQPADEQQAAVAARFRRQATPSIRATYFRSVLENPDFRFKRWHIDILEVAVVGGTTRVKVHAIPIVKSRFAAITSIDGCLNETYELNGESLTLLKTEPPVDHKVAKVFGFDGF